MRFINGLNDSALACELLQGLQDATNRVTMQELLLKVQHYKATIKELATVRVQAEAARNLMNLNLGYDKAALFSKDLGTPGGSGDSSSGVAPKKQLLQAAKACVQSGQFAADHDLAPCVMRGHTSHLNHECRSPAHPRNQRASSSSQQAAAALDALQRKLGQLPSDVAASAMQGDVARTRQQTDRATQALATTSHAVTAQAAVVCAANCATCATTHVTTAFVSTLRRHLQAGSPAMRCAQQHMWLTCRRSSRM
jgi:hypothetical protein